MENACKPMLSAALLQRNCGPALHTDQRRLTKQVCKWYKNDAACECAFCKMRKNYYDSIVTVLPVVCKTQLVAQAKKL
jgi:hypothetical protein